MTKFLTYLTDSLGNKYVGIKFTKDELKTELDKWMETFDLEDNTDLNKLLKFSNNKHDRDGEEYHITLFSVMEFNMIKSVFSFKRYDGIDDIKFEGIGKVIKNSNEAHYIVVSSQKLDSIRADYEFEKKDLHITLGFDKKDVHGVDKGVSTIFKQL